MTIEQTTVTQCFGKKAALLSAMEKKKVLRDSFCSNALCECSFFNPIFVQHCQKNNLNVVQDAVFSKFDCNFKKNSYNIR